MAIVLIITPESGDKIELPILSSCSIGRSSSCDLKLDDSKISAKHGLFELNPKGELFYSDLGSSNGSFLNGSQIQKVQFKINEILQIGNTSIFIDPKHLTAHEQKSLGQGLKNNSHSGISLPRESNTSKPTIQPKIASKIGVKKNITLNKNLKKNAIKNDSNDQDGTLELSQLLNVEKIKKK